MAHAHAHIVPFQLESDLAYGFSDFPYIVVSEAEEKEDFERMAIDADGLERELEDADRTIDIALNWSDDDDEEDLEEMLRDGAMWAAELDRVEAERQIREEEKARAAEAKAQLDAILDAEFEVCWVRYLAKKEKERREHEMERAKNVSV
jgi:hypothetical protein